MKKYILILIVFSLSCSKSNPVNSQNTNSSNDNSDNDLNLIWSDEFSVDGAPSLQNWFLETVPPNNGSWWNNEEQYYTDRRENSIVEGVKFQPDQWLGLGTLSLSLYFFL